MSEPASITIQRRIEWSDTDASGHWHNVAAFRMLEWAETALLDRLGLVDNVYAGFRGFTSKPISRAGWAIAIWWTSHSAWSRWAAARSRTA
jgi:hypothetical protein